MKQILLYNPIFSFVAEEFINAINDAGDEDITIRVNSPGGSVFAGWGMAAALSEKKNVTVKVDGVAASMAFYLLLFADIMKMEVLSFIDKHQYLVWEVNFWYFIYAKHKNLFNLYFCNHDTSIINNY